MLLAAFLVLCGWCHGQSDTLRLPDSTVYLTAPRWKVSGFYFQKDTATYIALWIDPSGRPELEISSDTLRAVRLLFEELARRDRREDSLYRVMAAAERILTYLTVDGRVVNPYAYDKAVKYYMDLTRQPKDKKKKTSKP